MSSRAASKLAGRVAADKRKAVSEAKSHGSGGRGASRTQICRALKEHSLTFLRLRFGELLEKLEETLFDKAQNSASNADQTQYLEAMTEFRERRNEVMKLVWAEFAVTFDEYFTGKSEAETGESGTGPEIDFETLELLDQTVWEDDLAVSIMSSRAEERCSQILWALNRRLTTLSGRRLSDNEDNPLSPNSFATALQKCLSGFDITEKAKSAVYEQFDTSVLNHIDTFLQESNELLAEKGILPDLKYSVGGTSAARGTASTAGAANNDNYQAEQESVAAAESYANFSNQSSVSISTAPRWHESLRAEQRLLDAIIQWQVQNLAVTSTGITGAGVPLGPIFSADSTVGQPFNNNDYVTVLNQLQLARKQYLEQAGGGTVSAASVMDFQKEFVGRLSDYAEEASEEKMVPAADAGTIDLVGTIFNEILNEETLPDNAKALLSHLHTPFLKIALIDRGFMQEAEHPARLLLNELAEAGTHWLTGDNDRFKVYDKLYQVVHRLIDDFDAEIGFINDLREDFANFVERLEKRASMAEKRSLQAEEGLDKIEVAKQKSAELFHRRAEARGIPVASRDILESCWVDFLVFVFLRFGADSETWKKAVLMLNQVFVRVHAAIIASDRSLIDEEGVAELIEVSDALSPQSAIAKIDVQLRTDILDLGYAPEDVSRMFEVVDKASAVLPEDDWRAKYVNVAKPANDEEARDVIQGVDIGAPDLDEDEALQADINLDFEVPQLEDDLSEQEQALRENLRDIEYGTWFEWIGTGGNVTKKLKLAWYSSMSDNYMFVNNSGVKVLVESLNNLSRNVHRGHVRIVNPEKNSFMGRMFKKMVNNMQTSA